MPHPLPTTAAARMKWNGDARGDTFGYDSTKFAFKAKAATANSATLLANANRGFGATAPGGTYAGAAATLNMTPRDYNTYDAADMATSLTQTQGDLYALSLHSMAVNQHPLYASGGGRWYFHDPNDPSAANKPLLDVSTVFEGSTVLLTGKLSGITLSASLTSPFLSNVELSYGDWRPEPTGALYIDRAGQTPDSVTADADRRKRLQGALGRGQLSPDIATGERHTCVIADGTGHVKCWGYNYNGQLGNGTKTTRDKAVDVLAAPAVLLTDVAEIVAARLTTCARLTNGNVKCWGANNLGQPGNGDAACADQTMAVDVSGLQWVTQISAAGDNVCARLSDGTVRCWGDNTNGVGPLGSFNGPYSTVPIAIAGVSGVAGI